jgi:hypothetical protein
MRKIVPVLFLKNRLRSPKKTVIKGVVAPLIVVLWGILTLHGFAQATTCPSMPSNNDRIFTLTTSPGATCLAYGTGNLNGNNDAVDLLGYVTLDKSDDSSSGLFDGSLTFTPPTSGLSGSFSIDAPDYSNFVVALKSGEGGADPDWAAFLLPANVFSGSWAISGSQQLSHAILYGIESSKPNPVPEPATIALLASGIAILGFFGRRKRPDLAVA